MSLWQLALFLIGGMAIIQVLRMIESSGGVRRFNKRSKPAKTRNVKITETIVNKQPAKQKKVFTNDNRTKEKVDKRKGDIGEYTINLNISRLGKEYKQLDNLMLWINGKTTEIDHVVISPTGIFTIETKNRAGYLYGSENQREWTQVLNKNSKYKFPNPIKQNEHHIKALKQNLQDFEHADYFSIIAFTRRATLKAVPKSKDFSYYVVFNSDVEDTIRIKRNNKCLSEAEVEKIYKVLKERNIKDPVIRERHKTRQKKLNSANQNFLQKGS